MTSYPISPQSFAIRPPVWSAACLIALLLAGCYGEEEIRTYTVDKVATVKPGEAGEGRQERMLASIMLPGAEAWFFKLNGPVDAVAEVEEEVDALIRNVTFDAAGKPQWNAPDDWKRQPASGFRFATLEIPTDGEEPLELSVTSLPQSTSDADAYVLDNVNRWRGQLGQPPLELDELSDEVEQIDVHGVPTTLVDITGVAAAGGMQPPFMAGGGAAPPTAQPSATQPPENQPSREAASPRPLGPRLPDDHPAAPLGPAQAGGSDQVSYQKPAGWSELPASGFRKAAFEIDGEQGRGVLTVIDLSAQAGSLLDNVNRWRGQIQLQPLAADQLDGVVEEADIGGETGQLVELVGTEQAILGAVLPKGDKTWFIKLQGDAGLVKSQRENFDRFLKSLKLK